MAAVKTSGLVDALKGTINGSVLQFNNGGQIMRSRKPSCRSALYTNNVMQNITPVISGLWKTLTATEQATWSTQAPNYPSLDKFGNTRTPSAYNLFVNLNASLARMGEPPVISASAPVSLTNETGYTVGPGSLGALTVTLPYILKPDEVGRVEATPPFTPGRVMPQGYWRYMQRFTQTNGVQVNLTTPWERAFGHPLSGQQFWVAITVYSKSVGNRTARIIINYVNP